MGGRQDGGVPTDKGQERSPEKQREQRRKFDEAVKRQEDARKLGQEVGDRGKGAPIPKESTLDKALHVVKVGVEAGTQAAETAAAAEGAGAAASGAALIGVAAYAALQGREIVKAIGEVHEGNKAEAIALGTRHALSLMIYDHEHPNNPHIRDGTPYSKAEIARRADEPGLRSDRERWMPGLSVENSGAPAQYAQGRDQAVDGMNAALRQCNTPQERQQAAKAFTDAAAQAMAPQRRQWNQKARGQQP
jgi:hypothetical protein